MRSHSEWMGMNFGRDIIHLTAVGYIIKNYVELFSMSHYCPGNISCEFTPKIKSITEERYNYTMAIIINCLYSSEQIKY